MGLAGIGTYLAGGPEGGMTVEACALLAKAKAMAVFGVQWSVECWGGKDIQAVHGPGSSE